MSKKAIFFIVYFFSFTLFSALLFLLSELIGLYLFGGGSLVEHFLSSRHDLGMYRLLSYGVSMLIAADLSFRVLIFCCSKNSLGLSIDLAITLIDDKTLKKIYIKKYD